MDGVVSTFAISQKHTHGRTYVQYKNVPDTQTLDKILLVKDWILLVKDWILLVRELDINRKKLDSTGLDITRT